MAAIGACCFPGGDCSPLGVKSSSSSLPSYNYYSGYKPELINCNMISSIVAVQRRETTRTWASYETTVDAVVTGKHVENYDDISISVIANNNNNNNNNVDDDVEIKDDNVTKRNPYRMAIEGGFGMDDDECGGIRKSLKDFFEESRILIQSAASNEGGPWWFTPVECDSCMDNSPLLLYLPGIDGVGLGLIRHHHTLGKMFQVRCLHIPVKDRTSFIGLVKFVEKTVRLENCRCPNRPIYLVGESLGACLALAVAAYNPDIDLVLVLANPGTSFEKSQLQPQIALLELIPNYHQLTLPYILSLMRGDPLRSAIADVIKGLPLQQAVGDLSGDLLSVPSYLSVLEEILPRETFLWKLQLLRSASAYVNARLHAIKAQTVVLCSGKDQLLPSEEESRRLCGVLSNCVYREFMNNGHFLFLEDGIDLATVIKGVGFYRHGKFLDYVLDYFPVTPSEFRNLYESFKLFIDAVSLVMFSTTEDGKVVKGLSGIPIEGPVLYVGYHMLLGLELAPLVVRFLLEKNILIRGIAHPFLFTEFEGTSLQASSYDYFKVLGAVPVSGTNFFKLMSTKSHALLYPGGVREACHRKGEEYKLFWPERSEFVRMAARFGAKIVPFGVVGEDDIAEIILDYDDQMKIPFLRDSVIDINKHIVNLRKEATGEVQNQQMNMPIFMPKAPGRFYYYFGKPIDTKGRSELRDKQKAREVYLQVKSEVENCLAFLRDKREGDPYRHALARLAYQATHGFTCEIPTFEP